MIRILSWFVFLTVTGGLQAQEDPKATIYVYVVGKDTVVVMPKGMEYKSLPSPTIKALPKVDEEKLPSGETKLIVRERPPTFGKSGGKSLTLRLEGTVKHVVKVGVPEGAEVVEGMPPAPKK